MIFYYVILLFLSWPQTRCTEEANLREEQIFDQLAVASESVVYAVRANSSENLQKHSSVPSLLNTTVHYENSNGFMPMVPSVTPSYDNQDSSSVTNVVEQEDDQSSDDHEESNTTNTVNEEEDSSEKPKKFEEDLTYSSEARIFLNLSGPLTNRRSFDFQDRSSDFELLKVNNETPAVANYQDFYENVRSTVNTETDSGRDRSPSGRLNDEREKRIENYGQQLHQNSNEDSHTRYYSYNNAQDTKKTIPEQEKVSSIYRQQDTANYNEQSAGRQNAGTISSSSRTSYEANELTHGGSQGGTYDSATESSRTRHRFSRPVVVAEPSNYKDLKFNNQLQNDDSDGDQKNLETSSSETLNRYDNPSDNSRQRSYHSMENSRNLSDENTDYSEYIERPRRGQKSRRRPYTDSTRKLPKEHRVTSDESVEEQDKPKFNASKLKSQRHRVKTNPWLNDISTNLHDDSVEDVRHDSRSGSTSGKIQHGSRVKNANTWSQISPNLEISHSNGIELDQLEKPKYVVNFLPVGNFDHATALGNSQGFDVSNAVVQNFVTAAPFGAFSTSTPLLNTPQSVLAQNLAFSKNLANMHNLVSTPVPDIIVGQNSFQSPVHTILLSQSNGENKIADTLKTTYLPSTVAPMFAITPSLNPTLQSLRLQNVQSNAAPRTAFAVASTSTPIVQHIPLNQMHSGMQQLLIPQPTLQTFPSFLQTPLQAASGYQIQVNPHGLHGQNLINQGNLQVSTMPTLLSDQPEGRINIAPTELHNKKNPYTTSTANFLASASLAVGQNDQKQATNTNSYYLQNYNTQQAKSHDGVYQLFKDTDLTPKTKTFGQTTQVASNTVLQASPTLNTVNNHQLIPNQQTLQNDVMQQLQIQLNRAQLLKNNRLPGVTLQTADNTGSHSHNINSVNLVESGNAHLPKVGTKNVEILNPNIKPSPIDTTMNAINAMHFPTAVLTTPIPIFSTITPVTSHAVNLQNFVDSLTESGAKAKLNALDLKASQHQERPMFNPINFVPNVDIIKNQHALNNKLPINEPLQQGLNLVPIMPGGNFFKPSFAAQSELVVKPKLTSDLQNYAEEMFKESLKTMYNSQKWNNDRKPYGISYNSSEPSDLAKLRVELQKLRASLSESKYRDILEAHHSENKLRTADLPKSNDKKKPDALLATLEKLLKNRPPGPIHIYHSSSIPSHKNKHAGDSSFGPSFHDDFNSNSHPIEFLTPPRPNPFPSKSPFHDKPMKKRPGVPRFKSGPRKPIRNSPPRPSGLETSASNVKVHLDGSHRHRLPFENIDFDSRHQASFNSYPTFTTSTPDAFSNILRELKSSNNKDYDLNHPRIHNLLGLLMKNKQLPNRSAQNYSREKDQLRQLLETEKHRQQFYDDALKDYFLNKFEGASQSGSIAGRKVYSGNSTA